MDLIQNNANLKDPTPNVFQVPIKGLVGGVFLSSDNLVLALAKRRSVLLFSVKALEQRVHFIELLFLLLLLLLQPYTSSLNQESNTFGQDTGL